MPAGEHTIKMYKSHTYDTFIEFAASTIQLGDDEKLMVKYSPPMMVNQPGNMIVSPYDAGREEEALKEASGSLKEISYMKRTEKRSRIENIIMV